MSGQEALLQRPLKIYGVLATARVSRNGRLFLPRELELAVKRVENQWIPIYLEHVNVQNAVGRARLIWNPEMLQVEFEGEIFDEEVAEKIRNGIIQKVSLGADYERVEELDDVEVIRGLRFRELSLVAVPGIPEANIKIAESADNNVKICLDGEVSLMEKKPEPKPVEGAKVEEAVVPFEETKKADEGRGWDADRAEASLRKWASSDGSGDKDKIDWKKYRRGFAWYNAEEPENFGSYKLPHHEVIDGELCVVWRGVVAAMAALMGARGGVHIPDSDRRGVYEHLAKHYKQFDKEPPAFEFVEEVYRAVKDGAFADKVLKDLEEKAEESIDLGKNMSPPDQAPEMDEKVQEVRASEEAKVAEKVEKIPTHEEEAKVEEKARAIDVLDKHRKVYEALTNVPTGYAVWTTEVYPIPPALPVDLTKYVEVKQLRRGEAKAKFYKIASLAFSQLTEGAAPSEASQAISVIEVVPTEFGAVQGITDTQLEQAEVDLIATIERTMKDAAWKTLNDLIIDAVDSPDVTNVVYGGAAASESEITSQDVMTLDLVMRAKQKILSSKIAVAPGDLVLVLHPKQYYDLLNDAKLFNVIAHEPSTVFKDALEMVLGCEIVISDQVNTGSGSGDLTTYHAILFKKAEAVGLAVERELRIEAQRQAPQRKTVFTGTIMAGARVKVPEACCRIITA